MADGVQCYDSDGFCHFPPKERLLWAVSRRGDRGPSEYFGCVRVLVPVETWFTEPAGAELMEFDTAAAMADCYAKRQGDDIKWFYSVVRLRDA